MMRSRISAAAFRVKVMARMCSGSTPARSDSRRRRAAAAPRGACCSARMCARSMMTGARRRGTARRRAICNFAAPGFLHAANAQAIFNIGTHVEPGEHRLFLEHRGRERLAVALGPLEERLAGSALTPSERGHATDLVHGVTRRLGTLDRVLGDFITRPFAKVEQGLLVCAWLAFQFDRTRRHR